MSSSVGHNSLVMAAGTAASRVTGQIRTILLAAAVGTTGLAANAYQAGSQIPQVIFTLVSGGIFNAVLVPQIVRTLESEDAEDKLNKLITFAITLLLGITVVVAAFTPLLTRLYVNGDNDMLALSTAFALWCVPQIFFYGLYTVVGQILAAKDHFGTYAWSSVGANVISCAGFAAFIALFGRADRQPLGFWTNGKLALTAGTWTLGVAFQALVLFIPLTHVGLHYKPRWGVRGIGLRTMGPVAAWSVGIVVIDQLQTIVNQRVMTSVPDAAMRMLHLSEFDVAGNASFQNAYTIYILPYSLIAVSIATAVFPKISQAISVNDLDDARQTLSDAMRNSWLLMCFFTVAFVVIPIPITRALLPSVSMNEAALISGPLTALAFGLPVSAVYLIVQRTFYAFEDGCRPFIFITLVAGLQMALLLPGTLLVSPAHWATLLGATMSAGYVLTFPILLWFVVKRFDGRLDGKRISATFAKAIVASLISTAGGLLLQGPVYRLFGASVAVKAGYGHQGGHMSWLQAVGIGMVLGIVTLVLYVAALWALRTPELNSLTHALAARLGRPKTGAIQATPRAASDDRGTPDTPVHSKASTQRTRTRTQEPEIFEMTELEEPYDINAAPDRSYNAERNGHIQESVGTAHAGDSCEYTQPRGRHDPSDRHNDFDGRHSYAAFDDIGIPENLTMPPLTPDPPDHTPDSQDDDRSNSHSTDLAGAETADLNLNNGLRKNAGNVASSDNDIPLPSSNVSMPQAGPSPTGEPNPTHASPATLSLPLHPQESLGANTAPRPLIADTENDQHARTPLAPLTPRSRQTTHVRGDISWLLDLSDTPNDPKEQNVARHRSRHHRHS
jgi:putative peptidoglycan lipid II flippase